MVVGDLTKASPLIVEYLHRQSYFAEGAWSAENCSAMAVFVATGDLVTIVGALRSS